MWPSPPIVLPFKSPAIALLLSAILGPIGLLYASFWGGIFMIIIGIIVISSKLFFPTFLVWIVACVWATGAVQSYNQKLMRLLHEQQTHTKTNC